VTPSASRHVINCHVIIIYLSLGEYLKQFKVVSLQMSYGGFDAVSDKARIDDVAGSSCHPLHQVLRRVCWQLADLAVPSALTVVRSASLRSCKTCCAGNSSDSDGVGVADSYSRCTLSGKMEPLVF